MAERQTDIFAINILPQ